MTAPTLAAVTLSPVQLELLGQALSDAIGHRTPSGACTGCEDAASGLCGDHSADLDKADDYLALARHLGAEVDL